jgi:2-polyprenyl-6-hydroxyphenyl methylase/3-demethylubiquinone-9 3-methyltransferase
MLAGTSHYEATSAHTQEIARGERFAFGRNWQQLLRVIDEDRINHAETSLSRMLRLHQLNGLTFLDVGCGSGLSSLAARRLGAVVHAFDFDAQSVACAMELRRRYGFDDPAWTIEEGSVLDPSYIGRLGTFDIVYSWGVLHHTGRMWDALATTCSAVAPNGRLFIAVYNDLGTSTVRWRRIKRIYNRLPAAFRPLFTLAAIAPAESKALLSACVRLRPSDYIRSWTAYNERGMHRWRDIVDWVGGYPYEVATPEQVFDFCQARGFTLLSMHCGGVGLGCNEFVFQRGPA